MVNRSVFGESENGFGKIDPQAEALGRLKKRSGERWERQEIPYDDPVVESDVHQFILRIHKAMRADARGKPGEDISRLFRLGSMKFKNVLEREDDGNLSPEEKELIALLQQDSDLR